MKFLKFNAGILLLLGLSASIHAQEKPLAPITETLTQHKLDLSPVKRISEEQNLLKSLVASSDEIQELSTNTPSNDATDADKLSWLNHFNDFARDNKMYEKLLSELGAGRKLQGETPRPDGSSLLVHLMPLRSWLNIECQALKLSAEKKDWETASLQLKKLTLIHKSLLPPETLIELLVDTALHGITLTAINTIAENAPEAQIAPMQKLVALIQKQRKTMLKPALSGELLFSLSSIATTLDANEFSFFGILPEEIGVMSHAPEKLKKAFYSRISKEVLTQEFTQVYEEILRQQKLPLAQRKYPNADLLNKNQKKMQRWLKNNQDLSELFESGENDEKLDPEKLARFAKDFMQWDLNKHLTHMVTELIHKATEDKFVQTSAKLSLLQIKLACHAYRHKTKAFPATLQDLVPKYLSAIPNDPFIGGKIQYNSPLGLLWCAGTDLKDNGGHHSLNDDGTPSRSWKTTKGEDCVMYLILPPKTKKKVLQEADPFDDGADPFAAEDDADVDPFDDGTEDDDPFGDP